MLGEGGAGLSNNPKKKQNVFAADSDEDDSETDKKTDDDNYDIFGSKGLREKLSASVGGLFGGSVETKKKAIYTARTSLSSFPSVDNLWLVHYGSGTYL